MTKALHLAILLAALSTITAKSYLHYPKSRHNYPLHTNRRHAADQDNFLKSVSDFFHRLHLVATKRCANVFDDSCSNGGVPGSGSDEDWDNNPGKRCANVFDDSCSNGGVPGSGSDEDWNNNPGKRCANVFDDSCSNGGVPGSGSDQDWLDGGGSPGRR